MIREVAGANEMHPNFYRAYAGEKGFRFIVRISILSYWRVIGLISVDEWFNRTVAEVIHNSEGK